MEENNQSPKTPRRRFGPILWPLLLIAFGLLLLLDTLGLLGRSAWDIILNLWPLLFIALGLDALIRKKEIFGPVFWIGLGGVFLLTNFGIFGWDAWNTLFRMWPLLLVTAGLEILLGKRALWLSLLVTMIIFGILVVAGLNQSKQSSVQTTIKEPLGSAKQAEISIAMAVGELNLYSLIDSDSLIMGEISTDGVYVRTSATKHDDTITYTLEHSNPAIVQFDNAWRWDLGLNPKIPMDLESSMGVGSMGLTLGELMLDDLNIGQGVGEVEVILPVGDYSAEISQAVGQIIIEIPEDVPVRIEISRAVSGLSLPSDFEKHDGFYYTPGARGADEFIKVEINQAIGNIVVRYVR